MDLSEDLLNRVLQCAKISSGDVAHFAARW